MRALLEGLVIGFSIAAPVGPIGLLCIRRSLTDGRWAGFVSGLGAATADAIYGSVAAFGVTAITHALVDHRIWIQAVGGAVLVWLGANMLRTKASATSSIQRSVSPGRHGRRLMGAFASTAALTLTNPMTILSFAGIFAALGPIGHGWSAGTVVAGVFLGSAIWWLLLSAIAGWVGARVEGRGVRVIALASGAMIAAFGAWQLVAAVS
jgi:threonine/homoserine/homoserine lactone efflux protein